MNNQKYHLMFDEIPEEVLSLVRTTIKQGLFKSDKPVQDKLLLLEKLSDELCVYYRIPKAKIIISNQLPVLLFGCCYNTQNKIIYLNKPSLVSFLHEFYHHLNNCSAIIVDDENQPRGWSHSVFFLATPKLFENALNKNLLVWQKPEKPENSEQPEGEN